MKQLTAVLFFCLSATPTFAQKTIRRSVYFESNQAQLSAESQTFLKAFADTLKRYASYTVALKGHTDANGSDNTNKQLSEKRVKNVQILLENNGILPKNITISVLGEAAPIAENATVEGKQRNRRVEIITTIYPPNTTAANTAKSYQNVTDLYRDLSQTPQYFKVNTGQETTIRGAKGTVFVVPKDAFQGVPANAVIDFKLKEAYSFSDIIAENLSTHSGDKLLQTGGMFYAEAVYNGQSVNLKKALNVSFASKESKLAGMQLFTGTRDPQRNGRMDWQPIKDPSVSAAFEDDTLEIFSNSSGLIDPYLISDKNGCIKFKDLLDTSNLAYSQLLVPVKDEKGKPNLLPRRGITKVGAAISFYLLDHRAYLKKTLLETHRVTFNEVYDFYKVDNLADLAKQNGFSWDSLIKIRVDFINNADLAAKAFALKQDSLTKEYARQAEIIRIRNMQREKINEAFSLPKLGWINCDKFSDYPDNQLVDIKTNNYVLSLKNSLILVLKRDKQATYANTWDKSNVLFRRMPKNKEGVIIGMKIENGQSYLALKPITTANMSVDLNFKAVSAEEIKEQLKTLDN